MPRKGFTSEQLIRLLKEAEILIGEGSTTKEAVRRLVVSEQTFYKWRRKYGGLRVDQVKRLKDMEEENARLKRLVVDKELDIHILKEGPP
jgi:putative transposase